MFNRKIAPGLLAIAMLAATLFALSGCTEKPSEPTNPSVSGMRGDIGGEEDKALLGFWNYSVGNSDVDTVSYEFRPGGAFTSYSRKIYLSRTELTGFFTGSYRTSGGRIECYDVYTISEGAQGGDWYEEAFGERDGYPPEDLMAMAIPEEYRQAATAFSLEYQVLEPGPFLVLAAQDSTDTLLGSTQDTLPFGCWETTDRGGNRRDITLDGETTSIRADWRALELTPDGAYSLWERDWKDGQWEVRRTRGRAATDGAHLLLRAHSESLYQSAAFEGLANPVSETPLPARPCMVLTITELDEDTLDIEGWEGLYNFVGKDDRPPWVWPGEDMGDTPVQPLSESDKYVLELAESALALLKNKDWGALGALVHPKQGLTFSPYGYVDTAAAVCLGAGDVKALGYDDKVRVWGEYPSGDPIQCTFAQYYDMFIFNEDFTQGAQIGVNRILKSDLENNLYVFGNGCEYVDFYLQGEPFPVDDYPPSSPEYDWSALRLVFSAYAPPDTGDPADLYLVAIVHDQWLS